MRVPLWAVIASAALTTTSPRTAGGPAAGSSSPSRVNSDHSSAGKARLESPGSDRGELAETPTAIPARGWLDILYRIYSSISEDRVLAIAAGVTFYVLLAVFPGTAALLSIYGLFANATDVAGHVEGMQGLVPEGGREILQAQVERLASQETTGLSVALITGVLISLWSANGGIKAIFDALNVVYKEKEKRGFLFLNMISISVTLSAILFFAIALFAVAVAPVLLRVVGLQAYAEMLLSAARWPVLLICSVFLISAIYRFGPSREQPKWRWVTPGSIAAALLWLITSWLFGWYTENFGSFDATYGSLGAAIGFMTWIWISVIAVLLGAKLNAEMEHQTSSDTTTGTTKPIGARGAVVADTSPQSG